MSKYERRIYFDRLVGLRESYRQAEHEATSLTIDQAIAYAIDLFDQPERLDAILAESAEISIDTSADSISSPHTA